MKIREEVLMFAVLMEEVLRKNDHKGGWDLEPDWLLGRAVEEMGEAVSAYMSKWNTENPFPSEAADVANFLMMVVDTARGGLWSLKQQEEARAITEKMGW